MIWKFGSKTYIKFNDDACICLETKKTYKTHTNYTKLKKYTSDEDGLYILGVPEVSQWLD